MLPNLVKRFHGNDKASSNVEYALMLGAGILFVSFAINSMSASVHESLDVAGEKIERAMRAHDDSIDNDSATYVNSKHNRRPAR